MLQIFLCFMAKITLQTDFLRSQASINQFISGQAEVAAILRTPSPATRTKEPTGSTLNKVRYFASGFFLTIASYLLHLLCMNKLSKRVWVESRHAIKNATTVKTDALFQQTFLAKSINTHRLDTADFFLLPPKKTTFATHPTPGMLNLFHEDGVCRGMCHWFVYLYFKTRDRMPDTDQHLRAVGQQFAQGAPRQAAFLQSLDFPPIYDLLRLQVGTDDSKISTTNKTEDKIISEFQHRNPGVYGIYTSSHQVIYIKISELKQYLFDPNEGVMKIASPLLFKKAMARYFESHDNTKDIYVDLYTPR
jgi:hypothetical protein